MAHANEKVTEKPVLIFALIDGAVRPAPQLTAVAVARIGRFRVVARREAK